MNHDAWRREMARWGRSRGRSVVLFDSVGSTNRAGLEILSRSPEPPPPVWIFALEQRRGEGRRGRSWSSPRGAGIYASYVLTVPRARVELLPPALGVALCDGLAALGFTCRLKWPNDVLLEGKKLGGILVQARGQDSRVGVVAGFGVNWSHGPSDLPRPEATSLRLAGAPIELDLARCTRALAERVEAELAGWGEEEPVDAESIVGRYREWSAHAPGDVLTVADGDRVWEGRFAGFGPAGQLRLATAAGERLVSAGEIGR